MNVADDVVGFSSFHVCTLPQSALGKQGLFRNNVDSMDKFSALFAKGGLSLDRLRTLCLVAEAGSLTVAAEGEPTRVSLFSRQLRELESFFGARLAQRRGRRIALTEAGHQLAALARRHFIELTDFARHCAGKPLEVTLGASASVMEWLLMPRLPILRKAMHGARVKIVRDPTDRMAARLRDSRVDVAILRENAVTKPLLSEPFVAFRYALYVPRTLAGNPRSLHRWLPQVPMIYPSAGWTREQLDAAVEAAGLRLRIEIDGSSATLSARVLREGHCAAILPEIASAELGGADIVTLRPSFLRALERRLVIAWHPRHAETRPATLRAVEALRHLRSTLKSPRSP
jgi:DNA-binding transcriptional LysR family regulator